MSGTDFSLSPTPLPTPFPAYGAFLRAINVGKHNRVRMADVREAIAGLGYDDVRTYLPTGNVALRTDDLPDVVARRVEGALASLGLRDVDVMVQAREELLALDGRVFQPYPGDEFRHMAIFTRQPVEIEDDLPLDVRGVTFVATGAALLAVTPKQSERPVNANAVVEGLWKTRATTRWWNVVEDFTRDILG